MMNQNLKDSIYQFRDTISYYSHKQEVAMNETERNEYINQMEESTENFIRYMEQELEEQSVNTKSNEMPEFTLDELAYYNGSGGRPAYVAVNGIVYDMSNKAGWGGGTHFGLYAGRDLSTEYNKCHLGVQVILKSLPQVGILRS